MGIEVQGLNFSYDRSKRILDNISLSVNNGETLAIVGASGSGKSTLLKIISGLIYPNGENALTHQVLEIDNYKCSEYLKTGKISFMFQEATLLPNLNVEENLKIPLEIIKQKNPKRIASILSTIGLSEYKNYLPKDLSGGMKTRVALGRSFITNPEVLLLDEPFSSLDVGWKINLYKEFERLNKNLNPKVILVTHDIQEALLLCNEINVLSKNGSIVFKHRLLNSISPKERISNPYKFLHDSRINDLYLSIQKIIIEDGWEDEITTKLDTMLISSKWR